MLSGIYYAQNYACINRLVPNCACSNNFAEYGDFKLKLKLNLRKNSRPLNSHDFVVTQNFSTGLITACSSHDFSLSCRNIIIAHSEVLL